MNKGMDRDIALQLLDELDDISTALVQINDNEFVPHITVQPTDQTIAIGSVCTFSVTANNVSAYKWQSAAVSGDTWTDLTIQASVTDTLSFTVVGAYYNRKYRCKITGKDGSIIYSNEVRVIQPEPEG